MRELAACQMGEALMQWLTAVQATVVLGRCTGLEAGPQQSQQRGGELLVHEGLLLPRQGRLGQGAPLLMPQT